MALTLVRRIAKTIFFIIITFVVARTFGSSEVHINYELASKLALFISGDVNAESIYYAYMVLSLLTVHNEPALNAGYDSVHAYVFAPSVLFSEYKNDRHTDGVDCDSVPSPGYSGLSPAMSSPVLSHSSPLLFTRS